MVALNVCEKDVFYNAIKYCKFPNGFSATGLLAMVSGQGYDATVFGLEFYASCVENVENKDKWSKILERLHTIANITVNACLCLNITTLLLNLDLYVCMVNDYTEKRIQDELLNEAKQIIQQ